MRNSNLPVVEVNAVSLLMAAIVLLLIPLPWVVAWVCSVVVHELSHCVAVKLCGGKILAIRIGAGGAAIEIGMLTTGKFVLCSLAGPAGGQVLLLLANVFPRLALCSLCHCVYNLLPVYPLDGGRVLRRGLEYLPSAKTAERIEYGILLAVVLLCVWFAIRFSLGIVPLLLAAGLVFQRVKAKVPCKG